MSTQVWWLIFVCVLFFAIGIWIGWECWGVPLRERAKRTAGRHAKALDEADSWESSPHNPANY